MNSTVGNDVADNLSVTSDRDKASKTGMDVRAIQRIAERGEKIADDVLDRITGMHLDGSKYAY